ncbi:MAG TPA: thioredoxin domain-containing protein [Gemmatimonadales bacterium]|nr:thioredoxin domain-containing protein [Gemmatimonadales bacterium]
MSHLTLPVSDRDHIQGNPKAALTLVEYGDYECPYCGMAYPIVKRVQERLGKKLRFVFRNFPLNEIHPHALHAAEAAEAVAQHGGEEAFWVMHDLIYEHQRDLSDAALARMARQAGVDAELVRGEVEEEQLKTRVRDDFMSGVKSGVNGTPTFFINGKRHDGPWDEVSLVMALEATASAAASA